MALPAQNINHLAFRLMLKREKLSRSNFNDLFRQLRIILRVKKKLNVLEQPMTPDPAANAPNNELEDCNTQSDCHNEVACLMLGSMSLENYAPYDMLQELKSMFEKQARVHRNYNIQNIGKTIGELHVMFIEYEKSLPKKAATPQVCALQGGRIQKPNKKLQAAKGREKEKEKWGTREGIVMSILVELMKKNKQVGFASTSGTKMRKEVETRRCLYQASGRAVELEEIHDEGISPSEITSEHLIEAESFKPQEDFSPTYRSVRTHRAPERLYPESKKWLDAINADMQSIKDNQVWRLVDIPPNAKTIGSKWPFKKKTDMDGKVHTYKAHLVMKGYTQTYENEYEETFSHVAYIRAIRILIAIAAYYDYEIWQMDVEIAFLNRYVNKDIYMVQLVGFIDAKHPRFRMDHSKRGNIPMQERLDLNKKQCDLTRKEVKHLKKNPGEEHWTVRKKIVKYLTDTKDMFLVYGGNLKAELRVTCYCDTGFDPDRDDIKSQTGNIFVLNGGVVDWKSSKQSTTEMFAIKFEYIAASEAAMEVVWIRKFIDRLGIISINIEPIKMYCDNYVVILIANEPLVQRGTMHYPR
nr:hypothetical protein [Tanacetum cinerariifolium]